MYYIYTISEYHLFYSPTHTHIHSYLHSLSLYSRNTSYATCLFMLICIHVCVRFYCIFYIQISLTIIIKYKCIFCNDNFFDSFKVFCDMIFFWRFLLKFCFYFQFSNEISLNSCCGSYTRRYISSVFLNLEIWFHIFFKYIQSQYKSFIIII